LILDEAHHTKNPYTRLAGLFENLEARDEADKLRGELGGVFHRMLFLTATPFSWATTS
jgi:superfamily II DNA or RNA helicase